jgi:hypothetical protein
MTAIMASLTSRLATEYVPTMLTISRALFRVGLFSFLALHGCAQRSVELIHPATGAKARCGEVGTGLLAANVDLMLENCVKEHQAKGYQPLDKLSSEQRADLERRGLLSKPGARTY